MGTEISVETVILIVGPEVRDLWGLTLDVRGRRSSEAAKKIHKRSLWAVPLDGIVRAHRSEPPRTHR